MKTDDNKKKTVDDIRKEIEASEGSHIWNDYVNALKLISQVVFTRSAGFVLELLQNAEDAGLGLNYPGLFEVRLNKDRVKVIHNGRHFSNKNVRALCGIRSSKKPEGGTLGYLGIGFKSVFKITDCPEIYSNGFRFKFDRNHKEWKNPAKTPWHVLPIWIEKPSESLDDAKTTFIIPYREKSSYEKLVEEVEKFRNEVYLFLHWIKTIIIIDEVSGKTSTLENRGESNQGFTTLNQDGKEQRFKFIRRIVEVPEWVKQDRLTKEYRANVAKREIAIAFALDNEQNLSPSEAGAMYGGVYSFLPLGEAQSGAKFPIQADFLVQPGRDAINYEASWNHWLVEEICSLCKESINLFMQHERWKFQFLPAFDFKINKGLESHDKLFGPKLIAPIEKYLDDEECIPTRDGGWTGLSRAIRISENGEAINDIVEMGVLSEHEIAAIMGGDASLKLVHSAVRDRDSSPIRKISRWDILKNDEFLKEKAKDENAPVWFGSFYSWLKKHPEYEYYRRRTYLKTYHEYEFILTTDRTLLKGGGVHLLDVSSLDYISREFTDELRITKPLLHPDILGMKENIDEQKELRGFLTGLAGVQVLDLKSICKELILPKILTTASKPSPEELLKYTIYCQQILGDDIEKGSELWVITNQSDIRAAKEVIFSKDFNPEQNWQTNQKYVPGICFLSSAYIEHSPSDEHVAAWIDFFKAGGVKVAPDNGVEEFAMNYSEERLKMMYKNVRRVDKRNFGYDIRSSDTKR